MQRELSGVLLDYVKKSISRIASDLLCGVFLGLSDSSVSIYAMWSRTLPSEMYRGPHNDR